MNANNSRESYKYQSSILITDKELYTLQLYCLIMELIIFMSDLVFRTGNFWSSGPLEGKNILPARGH